ncbi:uncharacterized oxidoreductase At4g09670-like isoform X2 [Macadamia integrifolia]|uniref:uncharacterized oxidoreductase At4g09670-like isoform X2 n=1 Tax=Macadamia integrifolia TaxID=60698 RepID=UPI001C4F175C|nr:uncharacterized oxidoreductase At4g09670-like isoform X2 [Macadamia integrifolia]
MADTPIRFGVLGCAEVSRTLSKKLSRAITLCPNSTLVAVGSSSLDEAKEFAAKSGVPPSAKIYGSYEAVLDDPDVEAVYVPLPPKLHLGWAVLAAKKKKHLLLEKPVALNVAEFDQIVEACEANGVQFMDGTLWMHHPRTSKMKEFLSDTQRFGHVKTVHSIFSVAVNDDFLKNDIRLKPDLDGLGSLGDAGWYCIRSILWACDYELPKTLVALHGSVLNEAGVILDCGSSLQWEDGKTATFHCSYLSNLTTDITIVGTKGTLQVNDFIIPYEEKSASSSVASKTGFMELVVTLDLPQEICMVREFSRLVKSIKECGSEPESKWLSIRRKTQLVMDAVKASIAKGFKPIQLGV